MPIWQIPCLVLAAVVRDEFIYALNERLASLNGERAKRADVPHTDFIQWLSGEPHLKRLCQQVCVFLGCQGCRPDSMRP